MNPLAAVEQALVDHVGAPVMTGAIGLSEAFARVERVQVSPPVPVWKAEAAEMRKFVATGDERHSENASRLREMEEWGARRKGWEM